MRRRWFLSPSSSPGATHARSRTHIKGLLAALLNEMDIGRGQMGCHRLLNALSPLPFSDRLALSGQETAKDGGEQRKNGQTELVPGNELIPNPRRQR